MDKPKQGGSRKGSGAKPKYNEKTTPVSFKCPESKVNEFREYVKAKLKEYEKSRDTKKLQSR